MGTIIGGIALALLIGVLICILFDLGGICTFFGIVIIIAVIASIVGTIVRAISS